MMRKPASPRDSIRDSDPRTPGGRSPPKGGSASRRVGSGREGDGESGDESRRESGGDRGDRGSTRSGRRGVEGYRASPEADLDADGGQRLDRTDRRILARLQADGRASNLELAAAAMLSPAQSQRRHRRLEERGYIAGYETRLSPERLGWTVFAFIHVAMERGHIRDVQRFKDQVREMPEVQECYSVTGDFDYVIKVVAKDLKSLSTLLMDRLMRLPGVTSVRSSVCLEQIKCTAALPLD